MPTFLKRFATEPNLTKLVPAVKLLFGSETVRSKISAAALRDDGDAIKKIYSVLGELTDGNEDAL